MKKFFFISCVLLQCFFLKAQISFTTAIPQQPVVVGESFQVQYIIEGEVSIDNIKPPGFENFRLVAGPNIYTGTTATVHGPKKVKNVIYTLEALKPGRFVIHGASLLNSQKTLYSNEVFVNVISAKDASKVLVEENGVPNADYYLRPGEDPYAKIKQSLFVKLEVNKKSCYTGESVLATFKLYSSLQSKSDIIKNPGFYGFSVVDMVNLSDKEVVAEKVNGKLFDVHTIRKVQLFPLRAGVFTIDPMEIRNKVEFSRSAVNKKTEQEIVEGLFGNNDDKEENNAVYFESNISTEPVFISVKPLPVYNKPIDFNGAAGKFIITATMLKSELAKNEEGVFEITIKGTGNFIQLLAPVVSWPQGVDAFDPSIKDNFDMRLSPLTGSRTFRYPFVPGSKGENQIPPVQFSYFDIDSNGYKSISTSPVKFLVVEEEKTNPITGGKKKSITDINRNSSRIAAGIVIGLVLIVLIYWIRREKETLPEPMPATKSRPNADEILIPAIASFNETDNDFYSDLYKQLWTYLVTNFKLEGSDINKAMVLKSAQQKGIPVEIRNKLDWILATCETKQFTNVTIVEDRQKLLESAKEVITSIEQYLL